MRCCIPTSLRAAWSSSCVKVAAEPSSPTERVSSGPAQAQRAWVMEALQATFLGDTPVRSVMLNSLSTEPELCSRLWAPCACLQAVEWSDGKHCISASASNGQPRAVQSECAMRLLPQQLPDAASARPCGGISAHPYCRGICGAAHRSAQARPPSAAGRWRPCGWQPAATSCGRSVPGRGAPACNPVLDEATCRPGVTWL